MHFDPVNLFVVVFLAVGAWYTLVRDVRWHNSWIKKHDEVHAKRDEKIDSILSEMKVSNSHMETIIVHHEKDIERLKDKADA